MHVCLPREVGPGAGSVCREKIAPGNWRGFLAVGLGNCSAPRPLAGMHPGMAAFILARTEGCWPQPRAQHGPATPSIPLGRRKDVHPSMNPEPRLGLRWEYWWKGSPWRLGELGESPPDPCGRAALGSPPPSSQKHNLPLPFPAKICQNDAPAPRSPWQPAGATRGGCRIQPPSLPPLRITSRHLRSPMAPGLAPCWGAAPSPRPGSSRGASEGQAADAGTCLAGKLPPCLALHHCPSPAAA